MKRIACAVLAFIPLVALASSPIDRHIAPANTQADRLNPSMICFMPIQFEDAQFMQNGKRPAGIETCYPIDSSHHRERGYITLITDRGLIIGWKENTGVQECGYWTAISQIRDKLRKEFDDFIWVRNAGWHTESCQ